MYSKKLEESTRSDKITMESLTKMKPSFAGHLSISLPISVILRKADPRSLLLALQKTYQGVIFWLAANETVKSKVIDFLRQVLRLLKRVEGSASRKATETQLLALVVPFNQERLDYYWSALSKHLPLCIERLEVLENSTIEPIFFLSESRLDLPC